MFAPTGLNDWARFSRWVAFSSGPIAITKGLAEVSRIDRPAARLAADPHAAKQVMIRMNGTVRPQYDRLDHSDHPSPRLAAQV
jgi:hypothetical protein